MENTRPVFSALVEWFSQEYPVNCSSLHADLNAVTRARLFSPAFFPRLRYCSPTCRREREPARSRARSFPVTLASRRSAMPVLAPAYWESEASETLIHCPRYAIGGNWRERERARGPLRSVIFIRSAECRGCRFLERSFNPPRAQLGPPAPISAASYPLGSFRLDRGKAWRTHASATRRDASFKKKKGILHREM